MATRYMLAKDGSSVGPYHASQIHALWKSGQVTDVDYISAEGTEEWVQIGAWKCESARKESNSEFLRRLVIYSVLACIILVVIAGSQSESGARKGPPVYNSSLDGSVWQVKQWVKKNIIDKEAEVRQWGEVYRDPDDGTYWCDAGIVGKNAFGGPVMNVYRFKFSSTGNIISAKRRSDSE